MRTAMCSILQVRFEFPDVTHLLFLGFGIDVERQASTATAPISPAHLAHDRQSVYWQRRLQLMPCRRGPRSQAIQQVSMTQSAMSSCSRRRRSISRHDAGEQGVALLLNRWIYAFLDRLCEPTSTCIYHVSLWRASAMATSG